MTKLVRVLIIAIGMVAFATSCGEATVEEPAAPAAEGSEGAAEEAKEGAEGAAEEAKEGAEGAAEEATEEGK